VSRRSKSYRIDCRPPRQSAATVLRKDRQGRIKLLNVVPHFATAERNSGPLSFFESSVQEWKYFFAAVSGVLSRAEHAVCRRCMCRDGQIVSETGLPSCEWKIKSTLKMFIDQHIKCKDHNRRVQIDFRGASGEDVDRTRSPIGRLPWSSSCYTAA